MRRPLAQPLYFVMKLFDFIFYRRIGENTLINWIEPNEYRDWSSSVSQAPSWQRRFVGYLIIIFIPALVLFSLAYIFLPLFDKAREIDLFLLPLFLLCALFIVTLILSLFKPSIKKRRVFITDKGIQIDTDASIPYSDILEYGSTMQPYKHGNIFLLLLLVKSKQGCLTLGMPIDIHKDKILCVLSERLKYNNALNLTGANNAPSS